MNTVSLNREQADLLDLIAGLDSESIEKVKKYIRRTISNVSRQQKLSKEALEEWEDIMRPLTEEEKMGRLVAAENDPVYYTQDEVRKMVASWKED